MPNALILHPADSVVTVIADIAVGDKVSWDDSGHAVTAVEPVAFGHKIAIRPTATGNAVVKYGASIGVATQDIQVGQHVHVHNLRSVRGAATS
jgi:predicted RecA/RadA family phage recombinase